MVVDDLYLLVSEISVGNNLFCGSCSVDGEWLMPSYVRDILGSPIGEHSANYGIVYDLCFRLVGFMFRAWGKETCRIHDARIN